MNGYGSEEEFQNKMVESIEENALYFAEEKRKREAREQKITFCINVKLDEMLTEMQQYDY